MTSHDTFSIRFQAGRSLAVKSGYYANWVIIERSASAASQCSHCHNYCYHGYEQADESCASSCQCVASVGTGTCKFATACVLKKRTLLFSPILCQAFKSLVGSELN